MGDRAGTSGRARGALAGFDVVGLATTDTGAQSRLPAAPLLGRRRAQPGGGGCGRRLGRRYDIHELFGLGLGGTRRVDRFRRDTGIAARFVSELEEVSLSRDTCQEIVRIVQEALVNVRKHSEARHAVVRLERKNGQWKLTIDDDGRGFPFSGRRSLSDLDQSYEGPEIVKE